MKDQKTQIKGGVLSLVSRFPLAYWLSAILCFVLFPGFLINMGLNQVSEISYEKDKKQTYQKLNLSLERLATFSNDRHFAHRLLLKVFKKANRSKNPQKQLKKSISFLKKAYPDCFNFIVWDMKGKPIKYLSDEKSFSYMAKKSFKLLKKVKEDVLKNYPGLPSKIPDIPKELKVLRNFLGRFLVTDKLGTPYLQGKRGEVVLVDVPGKKSWLWYQIGKKISFLTFINNDFFQQRSGAKYFIKHFNKNNFFKTGISEFPIGSNLFPMFSEKDRGTITLALANFENLAPNSINKVGDLLIGCKYLSQNLRGFCFTRSSNLPLPSERKMALIAKFAKFSLPILIIFLAIYWKLGGFMSIRLKLLFLFLYAVSMPLLILSSIGFEYIHHSEQKLIYEAQLEGFEILNRFDKDFDAFKIQQKDKMWKIIKKINSDPITFLSNQEQIKRFRKQIVKQFNVDVHLLIDLDGKDLFSGIAETGLYDSSFSLNLAKQTIQTIRNFGQIKIPENKFFNTTIIYDSLTRIGELTYIGIGQNEVYSIYHFIGNKSTYDIRAFFQVMWLLKKLQKKYLLETLPNFGEITNKSLLYGYIPDEDGFIGKSGAVPREIKQILRQADKELIVPNQTIKIGDSEYSVSAQKGLNLSKLSIAACVSLKEVKQRTLSLKRKLIGFALICIFFSLILGNIITQTFFSPINQFSEAISNISNRNFSFRTDIKTKNEFGDLGEAFNKTLENLHELETARIVQENLLPGNRKSTESLEVFAETISMSQVGGDYYDFIELQPDRLNIFLGDVVGHGVAASLLMAMAKSIIIYEKNKKSSPEQLMTSLGNMLFTLRKKGAKEYMTGQLLTFDNSNDKITLINSGHPYPIKISKDGKHSEFLKIGGFPLGFQKNAKHTTLTSRLLPGETIVLYTDGIVESSSDSGELLGFDRLQLLVRNSWHPEPEIFFKNLISLHSKWGKNLKDDISLVIIKRKEV